MRAFRRIPPVVRAILAIVLAIAIGTYFVSRGNLAILEPAGQIAGSQKQLLIAATLIMLLVVIPVFALTIHIAWKYRAGNKQARYEPEWDTNNKLEALWWGFPLAIVLALSVIIYQSSHTLDPSRPIANSGKPLVIQVVALQWKWLFLYPDQQVAAVNYVQIPVDTPVEFQITADAPMNSFWIPKLGGQIYAMEGMTTRLNLEADKPGIYDGSSANLSGEGFSAMRFTANASSQTDFDDWVQRTQNTPGKGLDTTAYDLLAQPAVAKNVLTYKSFEPGLFTDIQQKFNTGHGTGDSH